MALRFKATPLSDSDGSSNDEEDEQVHKRIKVIRELSELEKPAKRFGGGIIVSSESESNVFSASLSAAEKKGIKEVQELERELDLKNTFSKETNRRDEDAEMKKYIDEQVKLRLEAARRARQGETDQNNKQSSSKEQDSELGETFALPATTTDRVDDILLQTLSRDFASVTDEKSEAMLSSQMLNGIPEVDLGMDEKIRTIEATEGARLRLASAPRHSNRRTAPSTPSNFSCNFQHHRSTRDKNDDKSKPAHDRHTDNVKTAVEPIVSVGEEPKEIEYRLSNSASERPPPRGRASDDYYLQKFRKNTMR